MSDLNFPSSPTDGQTYSLNGASYVYNASIGTWISTTVLNPPYSNIGNGQILFNENNIIEGSNGAVFDKTSNTIFFNDAVATLNVTATYFKGNGALLTGVVSDFSPAFDKANSAETIAIAAFDKANTGSNVVVSNVYSKAFVANGAQTIFTLDSAVTQQNNIIVSVDGLLQIPGMHYTVSGADVIFTSQPIDKSNIEVRLSTTTTTQLSDFYVYSNAVGTAANTIAIAAFDKANTSLPNTSDVSFAGNLSFPAGNITVGNTTTSYNITVNGIELGFRNIPWSGGADKTSAYNLAKGDVGEFVSIGNNGSIVLPNSTFTSGDIISIFNNTANTANINCASVTAYVGGNNTPRTANVALATRGICSVFFYSSNVCVITGNIT